MDEVVGYNLKCNNANQSRFCPLGPCSHLPALVPWFTAHLHCCSSLKGCAKNGNVTGTTSIFFLVFLRWRKIFLNLDHLNDLISAQLNKQQPQHKCPVSGGIWAATRGRAIWQKNSWITFGARGKNGSTPLEAHELHNAFVTSSLSSRRAGVGSCY